MRKASSELLEQGIQAPSPAPDLIPAKSSTENLHSGWYSKRGHFITTTTRHCFLARSLLFPRSMCGDVWFWASTIGIVFGGGDSPVVSADSGQKWHRAYALRVLGTLTVMGTVLTCSLRAEIPRSTPALLRGDLHPGQYAVGFKVLYETDQTRKWLPSESQAKRATTDKGRPIRISVWYPPVPAKGTETMRYGDYFHYEGDDEFRDLNDELEKYDRRAG